MERKGSRGLTDVCSLKKEEAFECLGREVQFINTASKVPCVFSLGPLPRKYARKGSDLMI